MKYAGKTFTLYANEPMAMQGSESLYTYQNIGTGTATIQGSNNGSAWITITTITGGTSYVGSHSYAFLKMSGSTEVSVNRGEAGTGALLNNGTPVSQSNPLQTLSNVDYRTSQVAATLGGKNYKGWVTRAGASAKYSAVQVWNPVGSGVTLFVVSCNGFNSTGTMKWYAHLNQTELLTSDGYTRVCKSGQTAAAFTIRSALLDAKTATDSFGTTITSTVPQGAALFTVGEFYIVAEGWGLSFEGDTANVGMNLITTVIQIPSSEL